MFEHILRHPRAYSAIIALIAIAGALATGASAYRGAQASEERDLVARAQTIARLLDPREISFITGSEGDERNPFYASLKQRFKGLKEANADVRFIYLTGMRENGDIFFYVDSEPEGSLDMSPPGQVYSEASDVFREVFTAGSPRFEGPIADRWGNWISAFVPIRHPGTEKVVAVLGLDIAATEYYRRVVSAALLPILFTILFLMVIFVIFREYRKREEILSLKAEFVSIASHELRSPLTGLYWAIQTLLRGADAARSPALKDTLVSMERASKSLLDTVAGVLDFSRLQHVGAGGLQTVDLDISPLTRECVDALTLFAGERGVHIEFDREWPERIPIAGDHEKIRRAVNNVISNAVKYSPSGGAVTIAYRRDGGEHIVSVANSGESIAVRDQEKVFSRFFRAGNAAITPGFGRAGTGLGLYFAKQIIEAHGGRIWFRSSAEEGTIFYIALSAVDQKRI